MKRLRFIIIIIALIFLNFNAKSQYLSMLNSQNKWRVIVKTQGIQHIEEYRVGNDTTIFNQTWKKIKMISDSNAVLGFVTKFYLREDTINKKVYALKPDQSPYLYFDFNANINDTVLLYNILDNAIDTFAVNSVKMWMTADSVLRRAFMITNTSNPFSFEHWIEGVGSTEGIYYGNKLLYSNTNTYKLEASCFNNNLVYYSDDLLFGICNLNVGISGLNAISPNIYPNPASDFLQIENIDGKITADIYSMDGKLQKTVVLVGNNLIKINDLTMGVYILKIRNDKDISYHKFIKQ